MRNSKTALGSFLVIASLLMSMFLTSCMGAGNSFTLNNDNITLTVGESSTLTANQNSKDIVWSSSDESVAKVDSGKVEAVAKGDATITAMLPSGEKATCDVKVKNVEVESIQLDSTNLEVTKDKCVVLTAKIYPAEASSESLEWRSDDPNTASVDSNGTVTGNKQGNTVIYCTASNGKSASCSVRVKGTKKSNTNNNSSSGNTTINNYYDTRRHVYTNSISDATLYCRASDFATLRANPSRKARKLATVKSRESVQCLDYDEEFYYVVYQGKRGYVLRDYFSADPDAPLNYGNN